MLPDIYMHKYLTTYVAVVVVIVTSRQHRGRVMINGDYTLDGGEGRIDNGTEPLETDAHLARANGNGSS